MGSEILSINYICTASVIFFIGNFFHVRDTEWFGFCPLRPRFEPLAYLEIANVKKVVRIKVKISCGRKLPRQIYRQLVGRNLKQIVCDVWGLLINVIKPVTD